MRPSLRVGDELERGCCMADSSAASSVRAASEQRHKRHRHERSHTRDKRTHHDDRDDGRHHEEPTWKQMQFRIIDATRAYSQQLRDEYADCFQLSSGSKPEMNDLPRSEHDP